jgi:hypothetical protein
MESLEIPEIHSTITKSLKMKEHRNENGRIEVIRYENGRMKYVEMKERIYLPILKDESMHHLSHWLLLRLAKP